MSTKQPHDRERPEGSEEPLLAGLFWRDEILQVIYWYQGEGFGTAVSARDLQTFLAIDERFLSAQLEQMAADGYLQRHADHPEPHYSFTPYGHSEGARRFADEFSGLTGQAHGECNNPNCACQTMGPEACESRTAHSHQ